MVVVVIHVVDVGEWCQCGVRVVVCWWCRAKESGDGASTTSFVVDAELNSIIISKI